ncbi:uncharacterized protein LOC126984247 [Eriocheir sinensis]|uniref:uncharacterized protein LOC126984247 n=1 Tax=Eriocheir sinensis TaxID=95602 RepID=UPI0021C97D4C|nr:uncharacterized protein LOC126984247 [Eriocheir sinensis]
MEGSCVRDVVRLLLVLTVLLSVSGGDVKVRIKEVRVPSVALEGDMLRLHCDYEDASGSSLYTLKWYKDGLEFYRHQPGLSRPDDHHCPSANVRQVEGVAVDCWQSSEREVVLTGVTRRSSGLYACEVIGEHPTFHREARQGHLTVFSEALREPRVEGLKQHYTPGDEVFLNCSSGNTQYTPALTWTINGRAADQRHLLEHADGKSLGLHLPLSRGLLRGGVVTVSCVATLGSTHLRAANVTLFGRGARVQAGAASGADASRWRGWPCAVVVAVAVMTLLKTH